MPGATFTLSTNIDQVRRRLTELQKSEVPYAAARAATDVAFMIRDAEQAEMRRVFNQPTAWTLGGMVVDKADPKSGRPARVRFEESSAKGTPSGDYLRPQMDGGPRKHTPFENSLIRAGKLQASEFLVPGKYAERDGAGNLNPGQIAKILSELSALPTAMPGPNARERGKRRGESYVIERPASGGAPKGIYLVSSGKKRLVFLIVRQPQYQAIFDFKGVAQRVLQREYAPAFRRNLERAVASSRNNPLNMVRAA